MAITAQARFAPPSNPPAVGLSASRAPLSGRLLLYGALALILALHVGGALYWIWHNIVLVGHDASEYLETSIEYTRFLTPLSVQTLFHAFTYPLYRTPALYLAAQPFYAWFGVDMDSAQLLNVVLFAGVILLTFALGRHLAGDGVGLFAALFAGLLPLLAAMARLFYTEMFLSAVVVLNLLALYRSQGFARRGWALVWGFSLGLGLLVKWTMPLYIWLPLLWSGWQSGLWQSQLGALRGARFRPRLALVACLVAALLSTLWFWPNRTAAQLYPLGNFLWLGWFLLLALYLYVQLQPATPMTNWWAASLLALVLASLWYLPHSDFAQRLLAVDALRSQEDASPLLGDDLQRYLGYFYTDHLGPLAFWAIVPLALAPWLWAWLHRRTLNAQATLLWLSLVSVGFVLLLLGQDNPRNLVPLLPFFAILATIGLWAYPQPFRFAAGASWLLILLAQWSLFTFDHGLPLAVRNAPLWSQSDYAKAPSTGETDPAYWVGPHLLATITAGRGDIQSLGMLVNTHPLHRGTLRYLIAVGQQKVGIRALTTAESGWADLLASQWVLAKDGRNENVDPAGLALLRRITAGDPLFATLYREVERMPLPDGDTLSLYHRDIGPGWPEAAPEQMASARQVADDVTAAWSSQAQLVYASPDLAVWVGMQDPARARIHLLQAGQTITPALLSAGPPTWLTVADQNSQPLEEQLDATLYRARTTGDDFASLVIYGAQTAPLTSLAAEGAWAGFALSALRSYPTVKAGQVLPVELAFSGAIPADSKVSVRLVAADGENIASNDLPLLPDNRLGLFVPPQTRPGTLQLVVVVYHGVTLAPLIDRTGATPTVLTSVGVSP